MKMLLRTGFFVGALLLATSLIAQSPSANAPKGTSAAADQSVAASKTKGARKNKKSHNQATAPVPAAMSGSDAKTVAPVADPTKNADGTPASVAVTLSQPASSATPGSGNGGAAITFNAAPAADGAAATEVPAVPVTTVSFSEVTFDFGKIKQGETVKHKFTITNTGSNPLILENVKPSCGCTALDWPKDPIAPGKSGEIEAQFNSTGKSGPQLKNITITLNTAEHLERLTFTGEVIAPPVDPDAAPADGTAPASGH